MMDTEIEEKLTYMARQIAAEICRNPNALMTVSTQPSAAVNAVNAANAAAAAAAAAAQGTAYPACGTFMPLNGCENLLYAPITTFRFYRGGRTDINVIQEGQIPVVPGASVLLSQDNRPPWPTGCYSLRYRLANNGANHDEIQIEWFLDDELLDTKHYGSEIYNADGTVIGDGLLPVPLAMGQHCCVGGNNRLKARVRHLGNNNQIENIRLFVHHGKGIKCCSSCAMGRSCDCGHNAS